MNISHGRAGRMMALSISDPEGYLLEFETFKQHPENETLVPMLEKTPVVEASKNSRVPGKLGINATITWLYHKDLQRMETFFQEVYGMPPITDRAGPKIYHLKEAVILGLLMNAGECINIQKKKQ